MSITVDDLFAFLTDAGAREKIALAIAVEKVRLACLEALLRTVEAAGEAVPKVAAPERPNTPIKPKGPVTRKARSTKGSTAERLRLLMARLIKTRGPMRPGALAKELKIDSARMHNLYSRGTTWFILEPDGVHLTAAGYAALEEQDGGVKRVEPSSELTKEDV